MFETLIVLFLIAAVLEYGAATIGIGYGTTLAPILLLIGYEPVMIVSAILLSQLFAGFIAAFFHHKFDNLDLNNKDERISLYIFALTGIVGVVASILLSLSIQRIFVELYIAAIVMIVGLITVVNGSHSSSFSRGRLVIFGSIAGFNKGMSGGGYAPVTVTGQIICGIKPRAAVAITAFVEGIICLAGVVLYLLLSIPSDFILLIGVTAGAIVAAPLSAFTTMKLKHEYIKRIVGLTTFLIGLVTLVFVILTGSA